jgi:hypothetical protein
LWEEEEKVAEERERLEGEEIEPQWLLGGRLAGLLASCGVFGG